MIAYGLGVVTVSFYLRHNDIPDPDLSFFKAHYIYTGIGVLGFLTLGSSLVYLCMAVTDSWKDLGTTAIVFIGWGLLLVWTPYALVIQSKTGTFNGHGVWISAELGLVCVFCIVLGVISHKTHGDETGTKAIAFLLALLTVAVAFWYISLYSRHIYPLIPDQFGGGKPKQARLLFSREGAVEAQQLGISLRANSRLSEPVTLMLASDSFYALRTEPNGHIIQVAKDDVNGLREDSTPPHAVDVQAYNRGEIKGLPEAGDRLILTFSEEMDPTTLAPDWSGEAMPAAVIAKPNSEGIDELRFSTADGKSELPNLGAIELRSPQYGGLFDRGEVYPVTISQTGAEIVVTLGTTIGQRRHRAVGSDVMSWTPSSEAADDTGNPCQASAATEADSDNPSQADVDF